MGAVVGFAEDVKAGTRQKLSKEELARGGPDMKEAERQRKLKGTGVVKQAKVVFETKEGTKVQEIEGAEIAPDDGQTNQETRVADAIDDECFVAGGGGELFGEIEPYQQVAA